MSEEVRTGSCLCGSVRFEVRGPMREVLICHCKQCRKQHGHAAAFTSAPANQFRFIEDRGLAGYAEDNDLTVEECFQTLLTGLAVRYYKAVAS